MTDTTAQLLGWGVAAVTILGGLWGMLRGILSWRSGDMAARREADRAIIRRENEARASALAWRDYGYQLRHDLLRAGVAPDDLRPPPSVPTPKD